MDYSDTVVIRHGGRDFIATSEMAMIFEKQAERILSSGDTELVILRHSKGVDMVLISDRNSYAIGFARKPLRAGNRAE
jgi:hypothetical protein